jgi:predicted ABC-type ATPase
MTPNLYIIAGPNGAGKTTFANQFLPNYENCKEFVNADYIASGLSPFSPDRAAIQAGRIMLERIKMLAERGEDFGFETTLAGTTYVRLLRKLKNQGYRIHLFFLWVQSIDIALARIAGRVKMGGHNVPEDIVRRRYHKGLFNFGKLYSPLSDFWAIYDNSAEVPKMVAFEKNLKLKVVDNELHDQISQIMRAL